MTRRQVLLQALVPVLIVWAVIFLIAIFFGASFPHKRLAELNSGRLGWQTLFLSILVISCFMLKARVAMWNRRDRDWLAISFCWMDISIAIFFLFIVGVRLWPGWTPTHPDTYRGIYQGLQVHMAIACITLLYFFIDAIVAGRFPSPQITPKNPECPDACYEPE